jgi:hypothetical protein
MNENSTVELPAERGSAEQRPRQNPGGARNKPQRIKPLDQ